MRSLINKIWTTSPQRFWHYIHGKCSKQDQHASQSPPDWHTIAKGPAKGKKLYFNPDFFEGWRNMLVGSYDEFIFESIKNKESKIIWDIGAHFGYSSIVFSHLVKEQGKVYAFEPNRANFERLKMHLNKNNINNIQAFDIALSDTIGQLTFIESSDIESSISTGSHLESIMAPRDDKLYERLGFIKSTVECLTIDHLISEQNLEFPDIIKIDVEGAEFNVIAGASSILGRDKIELLIEVHNILAMYDILNLLHNYGFQFEILDRENSTQSKTYLHCFK